ncbi:LOW QUALITY PROTEIN: uncharacterized protein LOC129757692 [Uranotaenia lowii]|uniref:LOW QUALITY PROTEIN: uncharacterized protein LOC129757692 n=1 Tax=Uranotaenia lowii TaxID=190385 RepID=UPI0024788F46|nr:LOW QUALITY PROTEIN: uncharacterized protein LOC129757692 [Uranotaenia lowii]
MTTTRSAGWKLGVDEKACYIEVEDDEEDGDQQKQQLGLDETVATVAGTGTGDRNDEEHSSGQSPWCDLPDHIMERIFSHLSIRHRYYASLTCYRWYQAFYLPNVWSNFLVLDETLARLKFNYYSGWQPVLDHTRTQNCLLAVGHLFRGLDFRPMFSFNNMFQFMSLLSWGIEQNHKEKVPREWIDCGSRIVSLNYIFPCNMASSEDPESIKLFGTGGQLLAALKRLMRNLPKLHTLKLVDLILERYEANHLLDEVLEMCCMVLRRLHLVNVTMVHCPVMHIGLFLNLQVLVVSPQNIDDDVLTLLADSKVRHLYLFQNRYTPPPSLSAPGRKGWRILRRDNPLLQVHLRIESTSARAEILLQPEAPVHSMIYQCPKAMITSDKLLAAVEAYKYTLAVYGHEMLPDFTSPVEFQDRVDSLLVLLARSCPQLTVLMVRERISTATLLLMVKSAQNLRHLYVRRSQLVPECDWPRNPEWSDEFYQWLQMASRTVESTEKELSQMMECYWKALSDEQFPNASLTKYVDH